MLRFGAQAREHSARFMRRWTPSPGGSCPIWGTGWGSFAARWLGLPGCCTWRKSGYCRKEGHPLAGGGGRHCHRPLSDGACQGAYTAMGSEGSVTGARYILERLEKKPRYRMKKYEILRLCRKMKTTEELTEPLDILCEMGYLHKESSGGKPGRPGDVYYLNPAYL